MLPFMRSNSFSTAMLTLGPDKLSNSNVVFLTYCWHFRLKSFTQNVESAISHQVIFNLHQTNPQKTHHAHHNSSSKLFSNKLANTQSQYLPGDLSHYTKAGNIDLNRDSLNKKKI